MTLYATVPSRGKQPVKQTKQPPLWILKTLVGFFNLLCEFLVNKSYQLYKLANISLSPNLNHSWPFFPVCSIHLIFWNVTGHKSFFSTPYYLFKASPLSPTSGDWLDVGEFCDGYLKSFLWPLNILALWAMNMQERPQNNTYIWLEHTSTQVT